jgi:hypothetical protein
LVQRIAESGAVGAFASGLADDHRDFLTDSSRCLSTECLAFPPMNKVVKMKGVQPHTARFLGFSAILSPQLHVVPTL